MAGPETPFSLAQNELPLEEAMAQATAPSLAIVGQRAQTNVPTRQTPNVPPAPSPNLQFGVDAPVYGWNPGQEGFGQGQVQQIRTDGFVTPVAERQLPFGAIAARQQGISQRKAELAAAKQKMLADFDPFKGIGKAAPQHEQAFGEYTRDAWPRFVKDQANARFAGDEAAANEWLRTDPEGRAATAGWSRTIQGIANESAGMTERAMEILAAHQEGSVTLDPSEYNALVGYVNFTDPYSKTPLMGTDPQDFQMKTREISPVLSKLAFQKQYLGNFENFGEQLLQQGKARKVGPNRYAISSEMKTTFDDMKAAMAEEAVAYGTAKNLDEANKWLDRIIKDKVVVDNDYWSLPVSGGGDGKATPASLATVDQTSLPSNLEVSMTPLSGVAVDEGGDAIAGRNTKSYPTLNLVDVVSGQGRTPMAREFRDGKSPVFMHPTRIMNIDGELFVVGKRTGQQRTTAKGGDDGYSIGAPAQEMTFEEFSLLPDVKVPYKENKGLVDSFFGIPESQINAAIGSKAKDSGMVTVRLPDGKTGTVAADQLDAFKKKYPAAQVVK